MEDSPFEDLLADIIIQRRPPYSQKESKRLPMLEHIGDGLSHRGIGLDLPLIELFLQPFFEPSHDRATVLLMEPETLIR